MKVFKFTLITLACLLSCFAHAQENDTNQTPPPPPPMEVKEPQINENDEIFTIVQNMPRFPGCEDMSDIDRKKRECAEKKMLEYIYKSIKYPAEARANGIEGMVVISFVIEKNGTITDPRILRDLDGGCGEEALRIIESMPNWIPGKQRNQPVRVQFNLPVRFKVDQWGDVVSPNSYVKFTVRSTASYSFNVRTPSAVNLDPRGSRRVTVKVGQRVMFMKGFKQHPLFVVTPEMNGTVIDVSSTAKLRNKGDTETIVYIQPPRNKVIPPPSQKRVPANDNSDSSTEKTSDSDTPQTDASDDSSWEEENTESKKSKLGDAENRDLWEYERDVITRGSYGMLTHHPALHSLVEEHKIVAIVPINVSITDKKWNKNKKSSPEAIAQKEKQFQTDFQRSFYDRLTWMQEKNKLKVQVQDIATTNKLLTENGIENMSDLLQQEHSKIADILDVDAVFSADVEIIQLMSKGGAFILGTIADAPVSTDRSRVALALYDGYSGARIWEVRQQFDNNSVFWKTEKLIENMFKDELNRYFPYHVRF